MSLDNPEYFFCQTAVSGRIPGSTTHCKPVAPKSWPLNEIEEVTVLQEHFELAYAVPAELFVLEVHGVPGSFLAV